LRDAEDSPPNEPPAPRDSDEADTERPPPSAVAEEVLAALKPILEGFSNKLTSLDEGVRELRDIRNADVAKLEAIDNGVGAALKQGTEQGEKIDLLLQRHLELANGLLAISADLQDLRGSVIKQASHEGEQHAALRQSVT